MNHCFGSHSAVNTDPKKAICGQDKGVSYTNSIT